MGGFDRLRAFNLWPQHLSLYSVAACGVLVCGVLLGKRKYLYATGIVALTICIYFTGYRTAWVGMALLVFLVLIIAVRSRFVKVIALLVALGLLGAGSVIIQSLTRYSSDDEAISVDSLDAIGSGRINVDSIAMNRYLAGSLAEWFLGIGVYSSEEATLQETGTGFIVHSDILATLIECGTLGLLGYLFFLSVIGWILFRFRRYLPKQGPTWTFVSVGLALFITFTIMGIPGALYSNVFVGYYYYGFIGFVLAQLKVYSNGVLSPSHAMDRSNVSANAVLPLTLSNMLSCKKHFGRRAAPFAPTDPTHKSWTIY
jgi:O-antigen ligase